MAADRRKTTKRTSTKTDAAKKASRQTGGGTRKTTGSKKNSTSAKSRNQSGTQNVKKDQNHLVSSQEEIFLLLLLGFCIILFLSNSFGLGGVFGRGITYLFFGLFGVVAYIMPFVLFIGTAFIMVNIRSRSLMGKLCYFLLLLMTLSCFCELIGAQYDRNQTLFTYFATGSELHVGGGLLGGILCRIFCPLFGTIGAWICNSILFIIAVIMLSGHSAIDGIYKNSKLAMDKISPELSMKKELTRQKRENQRLQKQASLQNRIDAYKSENQDLELVIKEPRRKRIVTGVSKDTRIEQMATPVTGDLHEVVLGASAGKKNKKIVGAGSKSSLKSQKDTVMSRAQTMVNSITEEADTSQMEFTIQMDGNEETVHQTVSNKGKAAAAQVFEDETADVMPSLKVPELKIKNPKSSKEEQEAERKKVDREIRRMEEKPKKTYKFPPVSLLGRAKGGKRGNVNTEVRETAAKLQNTLESFGVNVQVTNVSCGPAVTRYELMPEQGVKVSRITNLADDIKLNLAAADIRIEAPIPGKAAVGIEVPNKENSAVYLRELLETEEFQNAASNLAFAVGKDIAGKPVIADIGKMPHLLIAGATGSGKSVCINTLIMSILYKANPEDVKLIMVDPKVVELSVYNGIPHLLIPVVTDPKKASGALNWAVAEMTARYEKFSKYGVRDIKGFNKKVEEISDVDDPDKEKKMPQIVIIVDELADLMMVAPGEVEDAICRLAQLARAAGIHLIIATQRPSVNVITGLIKANMPSRIAFSVTSGVDSRTILDMVGAEKLLGKGDMLFYPQGYPKPIRVQGAFVRDEEVSEVTDFLRMNMDQSEEQEKESIDIDKFAAATVAASGTGGGSDSGRDDYFVDAGKFIIEKDKASIGMLQRVFKIGFNRAARIMDQLAEAGVVGPEEGTKPRKILMSLEEFEQFIDEYI